MLILPGFVSGALWGAFLARKRGGNRLDILQYAAGFGIAFSLLATFAGIALGRILDL
jgi:hypothetical protein